MRPAGTLGGNASRGYGRAFGGTAARAGSNPTVYTYASADDPRPSHIGQSGTFAAFRTEGQ